MITSSTKSLSPMNPALEREHGEGGSSMAPARVHPEADGGRLAPGDAGEARARGATGHMATQAMAITSVTSRRSKAATKS